MFAVQEILQELYLEVCNCGKAKLQKYKKLQNERRSKEVKRRGGEGKKGKGPFSRDGSRCPTAMTSDQV